MTLDQFYRAVGGTAAEAAPRLGGADATRRFLRLFPLDDSFPRLSEALGRGDVQTAFRAAHTLKGVAANLGLERLRSLASGHDGVPAPRRAVRRAGASGGDGDGLPAGAGRA